MYIVCMIHAEYRVSTLFFSLPYNECLTTDTTQKSHYLPGNRHAIHL